MYTEDKMAALPYRRRLLSETDAYIAKLRESCDKNRGEYFKCDYSSAENYVKSTDGYRRSLIDMLGLPLSGYNDEMQPPEKAELIKLDEDEYSKIERIWVEADEGLYSYGLLFTPKGAVQGDSFPLVTALHGGQGTSEIVSSFYNSANYNDLVLRIRRMGRVIVYVPQLLMWGEQYNTDKNDDSNHIGFDYKLKQVGGSVAALEIFKIMRSVDWIVTNRPVATDKIGIAGLSYGGFYTLFSAAVDTRYKAALSAGFFNDRYKYPWGDWVWFDSASRFLDAQIAALVCPRSLCLQVGANDALFDAHSATVAASEARGYFERLNICERFRFSVIDGGHEFGRDDGDLEFFFGRLMK